MSNSSTVLQDEEEEEDDKNPNDLDFDHLIVDSLK